MDLGITDVILTRIIELRCTILRGIAIKGREPLRHARATNGFTSSQNGKSAK